VVGSSRLPESFFEPVLRAKKWRPGQGSPMQRRRSTTQAWSAGLRWKFLHREKIFRLTYPRRFGLHCRVHFTGRDVSDTEPLAWLAEHGDYLFRHARSRLRSDALAEDAVQETLLAALTANYDGRANRRTWLTAILNHKIVDLVRKQVREVESPRGEDGMEDWEMLFQTDGHWADALTSWRTPHKEVELAQLRRALAECIDRLKPSLAQVFSLREVAGWETAEICKELEISSTNCWVMLHRARVLMRSCLQAGGFGSTKR